jgi:hypothetical protein
MYLPSVCLMYAKKRKKEKKKKEKKKKGDLGQFESWPREML